MSKSERSTGKKWLIGCTFGCGVLLLIGVAVIGGGAFFVGRAVQGVVAASETHEQLFDRFGSPLDYVPPADGVIPADRMEVFLAIREALQMSRGDLETRFEAFAGGDLEDVDGGIMAVFGVLRGVGSLIDPIGRYVADRNTLLLDRQMGLGEYAHIYVTGYYSWLGHSPSAGPVTTSDGEVQPVFGDDSTFGAQQLRERYRRFARETLKAQLAAVRENPDGDPDWSDALQEEIRRFRTDLEHVAWQGRVPAAIEASLASYRLRLEATYSNAVNCLEIPPEDGQEFSITID